MRETAYGGRMWRAYGTETGDRLRRSDVARLRRGETEDRLRRSDAAYGGVAYAVR